MALTSPKVWKLATIISGLASIGLLGLLILVGFSIVRVNPHAVGPLFVVCVVVFAVSGLAWTSTKN